MGGEGVAQCSGGVGVVPSRIVSKEHIPGLGTAFSVRVPPEFVVRAKFVMADSRVFEESSRDES